MFVCPPPPPPPCFYFVKLSILCLSLQVSDQAIKSRKSHICSQSVIPQRGMQPDQTVPPLLQLSPSRWSPNTTELMAGSWSFLLQGGGRKKRREEKKEKPETWMKHPIPGKRSCLTTELKPRWPATLRTLSPPDWLVQTTLDQLAGFKESHCEVLCNSRPHVFFFSLPSHITQLWDVRLWTSLDDKSLKSSVFWQERNTV